MRTHLLALLTTVTLPCAATGQEALLEKLDHPKWLRRIEAMKAARAQRTPALRDRLIELATADPHHGARRVAIESLGYYPGDEVGAALRALDVDTNEDLYRASVLEAMARRRDAGTPERLIAAVKAGGLRRRGAVHAFALMPDPRGFDTLKKLFTDGRFDPMLSRALPEALLACDRPRALVLLFDDLADPDSQFSHSLVRVLRDSKSADVRGRALRLLDAPPLEVRTRAVKVLGACGDDTTVAPLERSLVADGELRAACATALGEIGGPRAMHALLPYASAPSPTVRAAVARGLGRIGRREAGSVLIMALRAERELEPQLEQARALGQVRDERAVADLVGLLDDGRVLEQPMGISALWGFPHNVQVRAVALWSLRTILDKQPPPPVDEVQAGFRRALFEDADYARMTAWWREHRTEPRYAFEKR